MEIEKLVKAIFMECLNDQNILESVKNLQKCDGIENVYKENKKYYSDLSKNNNSGNDTLTEKIDKIILYQDKILSLLQLKNSKKTYTDREMADELKPYEDEIKRLKTENISLKSKYGDLDEMAEVWDCINELNDDDKKYIESLCGSLDILAVLSLGRDDNKIDQLWRRMRDIAIKGDKKENELINISRYFEFCLKVANSVKTESDKYTFLDIKIGSDFDVDTCIRTSDSKQVGKIKSVEVKGVIAKGNIKYKSIVKVV